jgi:integrase/recombinase XerC
VAHHDGLGAPVDLLAVNPSPLLPDLGVDAAAVLEAWQAGRTPATQACYRADLTDFASWCRTAPERAAGGLLGLPAGRAHQVVLGYLSHLQSEGLASATVNRRIAALRSLVRVGRLLGVVNWQLELPTPTTVPYRDTRGPGRAGFLRLVGQAESQPEPLRSRNLALLWLLYGRGLRRAEACGIAVPDDVDLAGTRVRIRGKHRADPEWVTIPPATVRALQAWMMVRGSEPGPLLMRLDHAATPQQRPLTGRGVQHIIAALGDAAGLRVRPHGLRHAAITEVLDVTRGDHRAAQRFGRLRSANVLRFYDDNRADAGGEAAKLIAP